tara:strand:+ start:1113 stop:1787 length:675 start_codon:yes stop_codon:yes gene_type:complete
MEDLNKISSTRIGDNIHFFLNGEEGSGTVVKMDTGYVTVLKDDGNFQSIHINDTFFIKDILVNKSWNDMNMEERTLELHKIHAYSPRFLGKSWESLPKELRDALKSNVEESTLGNVGGNPSAGVDTNQKEDAEDDYEGETDSNKKEEFKHESQKPVTKTMQEQLWEEWLSKDGGMGSGSAPAVTSSNNSAQTNDSGMYNPVYGEKGRHGGQGRDKEEEDKDKKE